MSVSSSKIGPRLGRLDEVASLEVNNEGSEGE